MADPSARRSVSIERVALGQYVAHNGRGGELHFRTGDTPDFTPVELLLAAIGGCSLVDADFVTSRRGEPEHLSATVEADKVKDAEGGNVLQDIVATFRGRFPEGRAGDSARQVLPGIVARSHERLCSVSRTVEAGQPIVMKVE